MSEIIKQILSVANEICAVILLTTGKNDIRRGVRCRELNQSDRSCDIQQEASDIFVADEGGAWRLIRLE